MAEKYDWGANARPRGNQVLLQRLDEQKTRGGILRVSVRMREMGDLRVYRVLRVGPGPFNHQSGKRVPIDNGQGGPLKRGDYVLGNPVQEVFMEDFGEVCLMSADDLHATLDENPYEHAENEPVRGSGKVLLS